MRHDTSDRGQALAEVPIAVIVVTLLALCLIQVVTYLQCRTALGHAAVAVARVASVTAPVSQSNEALTAYAASLLEDLPTGSAFFERGSLEVSVRGGPREAQVVATLVVLQKPLPLVGAILAGASGYIRHTATATAQGSERWVDPAYEREELTVGANWNRER